MQMIAGVAVPTFDSNPSNYKEYRKRCLIFKGRMKLEKKGDQVALALLGNLTGLAWSACEELADSPDALEKEGAFEKLISLLDQRFMHEKATELPDAFEEYFSSPIGSRRKRSSTLSNVSG